MPWVILNTVKHIRKGGVQRAYQPGDSVDVGRQTALEWILDGSAKDPYGQMGAPLEATGKIDSRYGVVIRCAEGHATHEALGVLAGRVEIQYGEPSVPFEYTFIWRPDQKISPRLLNYGFMRIMADEDRASAWEIAACLIGGNRLANSFGTSHERRRTLKAVGDLRLPVYESRMVWVRKCPSAVAVIENWARQLEEVGADEHHAFLRALYVKRAMLCTMPYDWKGQ